MASDVLADARTGKNGRHALAGLFRQSVFGRLAGYEDVKTMPSACATIRRCAGLSAGKRMPAMRLRRARWVASRRQWLAAAENLSALADLSGKWIDLVHGRRPPRGIVLDMDSSVSPTHSEQEMSVWNGHYACTCYHPLFVFNQFGDLERCALCAGNVHSAYGWDDVLKPVVARYQGQVSRIYFRADAAFAMPEVDELLEAERIKSGDSRGHGGLLYNAVLCPILGRIYADKDAHEWIIRRSRLDWTIGVPARRARYQEGGRPSAVHSRLGWHSAVSSAIPHPP
jgi:Transposase DDE domain group 1